jgi:hypothetical protein
MGCYRCDRYADVAVRGADGDLEYLCESCAAARVDREVERQQTLYAAQKAREAGR